MRPRRPAGRWLAVGHAVRDWALANPAEYALIYGSPVPGYAPRRTRSVPPPATTVVLARLLADGVASGALLATGDRRRLAAARAGRRAACGLAVDRSPTCPDAPLLLRGLTAWIQLYGVVTFELFGRFNNLIEASRREFFDHQMRVMARDIGLDDGCGIARPSRAATLSG